MQRKDGDIEVLCKRLIGYTKSELRAINIKDNTHSGEWDLEELAKWTADLNINLGVKLDNKDQMQKKIKEMELIRFEKYDYVLLVCRNELDYNELQRKLGIQGAKVSMGRNRTIKGKGLVFDLEPQGKYMAFAQKASSSATSYTTMLCFSRANSIYDEYGVNLGCNLIGNWYTLKNFKIGSISAGGYTAFSGAIPIVCEITNNGNSWTYSHLRVYNGIIVGYWN